MSIMSHLRSLKHTASSKLADVERALYRRKLRPLDPRDRPIAQALEKHGAFITHLDDLQVEGGHEAVRIAMESFEAEKASRRRPEGKSYISALSNKTLEEQPAIFAWGLHERLLAIAEHYIGRPVFYRGLAARCDLADGSSTETRQFHLDYEDARIMKIIVYMNDVDEKHGPFEFIPREHEPASSTVKYTNGRVLDEDMDSVVPASRWTKCTGRAGTVVFADTCSVWHRGREPLNGDRYALFYAYNSKTPNTRNMAGPMLDFTAVTAHLRLTPYQSQALTLSPES